VRYVLFLLLAGCAARPAVEPRRPDRAICFVRGTQTDQQELWEIQPDGSGARRIASRLFIWSGLGWSPDGTRIAALGRVLLIIDRATGECRHAKFAPDPEADPPFPAPRWDPLGTSVCYDHCLGTDIYQDSTAPKTTLIRDVYGADWTRHGGLVANDNALGIRVYEPPTSKGRLLAGYHTVPLGAVTRTNRLLAVRFQHDDDDRTKPPVFCWIDLETGQTEEVATSGGGYGFAAPDGNHIAWISADRRFRVTDGAGRVIVSDLPIDMDGDHAYQPMWSWALDGTALAFIRDRDLWTWSAADGKVTRVTTLGDVSYCGW